MPDTTTITQGRGGMMMKFNLMLGDCLERMKEIPDVQVLALSKRGSFLTTAQIRDAGYMIAGSSYTKHGKRQVSRDYSGQPRIIFPRYAMAARLCRAGTFLAVYGLHKTASQVKLPDGEVSPQHNRGE